MKANALYFSGWLLLVAAGFRLGEGVTQALTNGSAVAVVPAPETGRVVRVVNGDTYDVLTGGVVRRVRLMGVDAPERDQPFGWRSCCSRSGWYC